MRAAKYSFVYVAQMLKRHGFVQLAELASGFNCFTCRLQTAGLSATLADNWSVFRTIHPRDRLWFRIRSGHRTSTRRTRLSRFRRLFDRNWTTWTRQDVFWTIADSASGRVGARQRSPGASVRQIQLASRKRFQLMWCFECFVKPTGVTKPVCDSHVSVVYMLQYALYCVTIELFVSSTIRACHGADLLLALWRLRQSLGRLCPPAVQRILSIHGTFYRRLLFQATNYRPVL